jgi:hypothetical protein
MSIHEVGTPSLREAACDEGTPKYLVRCRLGAGRSRLAFGLRQLRRILAQVEVSCSNSMIEALLRSLKHGCVNPGILSDRCSSQPLG